MGEWKTKQTAHNWAEGAICNLGDCDVGKHPEWVLRSEADAAVEKAKEDTSFAINDRYQEILKERLAAQRASFEKIVRDRQAEIRAMMGALRSRGLYETPRADSVLEELDEILRRLQTREET